MSYKKTATHSKTLTPELAVQVSAMPGLPGERELNKSRWNFLRQHLDNHTFCGTSWATAKERGTGVVYRINGQHSSTLLAGLSPEEFPKNQLATIDEYEFDSLEADAAGLFDLFDSPKSSRSDKDHMGIVLKYFPDLSDAGLEKGFFMKVSAGIAMNVKDRWSDYEEARKRGLIPPAPPDRILSHRDHGLYFAESHYRDFALWLARWIESKNSRFLGRAGVVSEILTDWFEDAALATEFWELVMSQTHPDPEHESIALIEKFIAMSGQTRFKQAAYQKKSHAAWAKFKRLRNAEDAALKRKELDPELIPAPTGKVAPQAHA